MSFPIQSYYVKMILDNFVKIYCVVYKLKFGLIHNGKALSIDNYRWQWSSLYTETDIVCVTSATSRSQYANLIVYCIPAWLQPRQNAFGVRP